MRTMRQTGAPGLPGWDRLRHGGLLLDPKRLEAVARSTPGPLDEHTERQLRQHASSMLDGDGDSSSFATFVLERVCGLDPSAGDWTRGSHVAPSWGRRAVTGETVKPRQLWTGPNGGRLPVFLDRSGKRLGIGRSRRTVSQVLGWLRAGNDHLAVVTNGRQWRLLFAGLDFDAWCEWDLELWFEHGELSPQVTALRTLLSPDLWTPESEGAEAPLLQAIRDTRKGQAELSEVLGERVREAVELLIQGHGEALKERCGTVDPADIYRAACRVAMRLVVILFAESRELLPRDNSLYHESYGLNGLLDQLERAATRPGALAHSFGGWPRVLALFALVRDGSHHPDLPVTAYGGDLFSPGQPDAAEGLSRALSTFESACFESEVLPDDDVYEMLKLLTRTTVRIRQGRGGTRAVVPVDFSDLSSEYIGILYEGLLDYELKTAPSGDPVIFLSVGNQPALPLSRLEAMKDRALKALFESLKKGGSTTAPDASSEPHEERPTEDDTQIREAENTDGEVTARPDPRQENRTRAETWARRAALAAGLVRKRRGRNTPERRLAFESRLRAKARQLVGRIVLPGEWYLVRWGGTRKGSGSFYTRPGLAVPTVQRTLRPLAYDPPVGKDGNPDRDAAPASWTPKLPERILGLKICDPACGSGTFPLAALRFLTEALYASLQHHGRIEPEGERSLVRLLGIDGEKHPDTPQEPCLADELIPCPPDNDRFESRLKAVLRRHVVERCIYAVDLDPLAVELCRLSLWIETMDRTLPFGFLDHKIKCGNSLIGAWFDEFRHYPMMAWKNREGGDKNHSNGVHFGKNSRTLRIKAFIKQKLTPDLRHFLQGQTLFQADLLKESVATHDETFAVLEKMHGMPVHDAEERARAYREELLGSPSWRSLNRAMDLWCACWFWPVDKIDRAPLPSTFADPSEETRVVAERIAEERRFFHWELEFPDVFRDKGSGFDAVLGNPPWENLQANPEEFFSNSDPLFRTYGRLAKNRWQREIFATSSAYEKQWLNYTAGFKDFSNWVNCRANPFGDPNTSTKRVYPLGRGSKSLHERWRTVRSREAGYADSDHPFRYQMGRIFTYRLLLEQSMALLRTGGRCGLILPSGIYSDSWSRPLRQFLLERCRWEWLFGIENRHKLFPIHGSFKFNPVIVQKGGTTEVIRTAFMRRSLEDWERAENIATTYSLAQIKRFSPKSLALLEIQSEQEIRILEKIYRNGVLLGDEGPDGWGIKYKIEFMMNTDAHLFPPRPLWEANGYRPDEYSRWLLGDWQPIEELWAELGVDPFRPEPAEIELEDWLFDTTAAPERREAEAQFVYGHLLKPGDVARTDWRLRCAQPPYDRLPIPRAKIPSGVILSREANAWIREEALEDIALPLYEGRMIGQFDFSKKGWVSGKGRTAVWREVPWEHKRVEPQYLMAKRDYFSSPKAQRTPKVAYMRVSSSTNSRTTIASYLGKYPAGDSVFFYVPELESVEHAVVVSAIFSTFSFDSVVRYRLGGLNMSQFVLNETVLPAHNKSAMQIVLDLAGNVNLVGPLFSCERIETRSDIVSNVQSIALRRRLEQICTLDAIVAFWMGLNSDDLKFFFAGCDVRSTPTLTENPKGFWRVDQKKDPELRRTVLTLIAFNDLDSKIQAASGDPEKGIEAFLAQNHGEGWMIPETLQLADYSLGNDDRAQHPQLVASRLGPRFYDWQLAQSADESWQECHLHARNLLGTHEYTRLTSSSADKISIDSLPLVADRRAGYGESRRSQKSLFPPRTVATAASRQPRRKDNLS